MEIFWLSAALEASAMYGVERQAKAEQGVKAVTCLEGDAVWKAGDAGLWSWDLLEAALTNSPSLNVGDIRENCRQFTPPPNRPTFTKGPLAFLIEYRDGLKAAVRLLPFFNGHGGRYDVRGGSWRTKRKSRLRCYSTCPRRPAPVFCKPSR